MFGGKGLESISRKVIFEIVYPRVGEGKKRVFFTLGFW
jgi:hypothetical protein